MKPATRTCPPKAYADKQAALWTKGLGDWGQDGQRIQRLRDSAEMLVYTPAVTRASRFLS